MVAMPRKLSRILAASAAVGVLMLASAAAAQQTPLVQPGAPGQASRTLEGRDAARVADNRYSADDVKFMQDMMHHHAQAVEMAALVRDRTNTEEVVALAGRIDASQADEIEFMRGWLQERGEPVPQIMPTVASAGGHAGHEGHAGHDAHAGHAGMGGHALSLIHI